MTKALEIMSLILSTHFASCPEDSIIALVLKLFSSISLAPGDSMLPLILIVALVIYWIIGEEDMLSFLGFVLLVELT